MTCLMTHFVSYHYWKDLLLIIEAVKLFGFLMAFQDQMSLFVVVVAID